jgi:ABC-2 type transport system permease protein
MRLIAEEKQTGTIVLLTSSPVRDREIVLGKYLSGLAFLAIITLATIYMPMLIMVNGKISFGHLVAGYLGLVLLGGTTLAIGTFGSALGRTQVMAAIISAVLVTTLLIAWMLARVTERPFNEFFLALALYHRHFTPFMQGVIHLRDVVYFFAVSYFSLFAATRVLEARRWR